MKTHEQIARQCGATVKINPISGSLITTFNNNEQLQTFVDCVNAQNSEVVYAYEILWNQGMSELEQCVLTKDIDDISIATARGWAMQPLFTSPQPSQVAVPEGCSSCNGTGDMHRADGEYIGECPICNQPPTVTDQSAYIERLEKAIDNLKKVKGRHNTEIACTRLFEMVASKEKP